MPRSLNVCLTILLIFALSLFFSPISAHSQAQAPATITFTLDFPASQPEHYSICLLYTSGRARYAWVTLGTLCWLVAVTFTASWHKILDPNPRIGFLAHARQLTAAGANPRLIFNDRLDAAVTAVLVVMVATILILSLIHI